MTLTDTLEKMRVSAKRQSNTKDFFLERFISVMSYFHFLFPLDVSSYFFKRGTVSPVNYVPVSKVKGPF